MKATFTRFFIGNGLYLDVYKYGKKWLIADTSGQVLRECKTRADAINRIKTQTV